MHVHVRALAPNVPTPCQRVPYLGTHAWIPAKPLVPLLATYGDSYTEYPPETYDAWRRTPDATEDDQAKLRPPHVCVPVVQCSTAAPTALEDPATWERPVILQGFPPVARASATPPGVEVFVGPGTHWLVPAALAAHIPSARDKDPEAPFTQLVFGTALWGHVHVAALESTEEVLAFPSAGFVRVPGGPLPVAPIPEATSLGEGLATYGAAGVPFVVRDAGALFPPALTLASLQEFALGDHTSLWGYDRVTGAEVATTTAQVGHGTVTNNPAAMHPPTCLHSHVGPRGAT